MHREQNGIAWSHFRFEDTQGTQDFCRVFDVADISNELSGFLAEFEWMLIIQIEIDRTERDDCNQLRDC